MPECAQRHGVVSATRALLRRHTVARLMAVDGLELRGVLIIAFCAFVVL